MKTEGSELDILQQKFVDRLQQAVGRMQHRLQAIRQALDEKSLGNAELIESLEEGGWNERLSQLFERLKELQAKAEVRQTLVVVGKRGQGKSTLLRTWLGRGIVAGGLQEPLPLPTGVDETTAALVRLSCCPNRKTEYIEVQLLPENSMAEVQPRPPRPPLPEDGSTLRIATRTSDPEVSPFFVMRYPVEGRDTELYLDQQGDYYLVGRSGAIPLPQVQYHAKEVTVNFHPNQLASYACNLLHNLDVVDAPGADPAEKGTFGKWIRNKSREIFRLGAQRMDLLLLVASVQTAAIQLGGQMQEEILRPWRERCQRRTQGRLLIVVTHAAQLFHDVYSELGGSVTEERSPARKLVGNLLDPLANLGFLDLDGDLDDWPPMFFVENDRKQLEPFLPPQPIDAQRESELLNMLDRPQQEWQTLSPGEHCILKIAADWQEEYSARWPPDKIRRIQRWIIHTLCRLLNDNDQGLGLLTQFVLDWAKKGPVARNYLEERVQMYNALKNAYLRLLNDLNEPDYHNILRELEAAHAWLKQRWKPGVGVNWQPGQRCKMRKDQAQINKGPDRARHQEFTYADALSDLVEDAIVQLEPLGRTPGSGTAGASPTPANPDQKPNVINALLQCLQSDFPMQQMETMYGTGIVRDPDALARLQAFGFERLTRVVDYLVRASESQLRQIMRYCYQRDLTRNSVVRYVYEKVVRPEEERDREVLDEVSQVAADLLRKMDSAQYCLAYK
jgi:hypothetical protein